MINYDGLYNKNIYGEVLNKNFFIKQKLGFKILKNAVILPYKNGDKGGIVDGEGNFIRNSFLNFYNGQWADYTPTEEIKYSSQTVIYLGMFAPVWGHCITDNLKFLWFLKTDAYQKFFKNCPIVYLAFAEGSGNVLLNFAKLLKILDLDISKFFFISNPIRFAEIILPDESFFCNDLAQRFFTEEYVQTVEQIKNFAEKNFTPLSQKKFYFLHSRGGGESSRTQLGEENLEKFFQSKGYASVSPQKLSLEEQLNIFLNCENFASTVGSLSHNTIFMKNKTQVILIPRTTGFLNPYQMALNQIQEQKIFYIDSTLSIFAHDHRGPFCYIISEQLKKFFAERYTEQDFEIFLSYLSHAKRQEIILDSQAKIFYGDFLDNFLQQLSQHKELLQKYNMNLRQQ